MVRPTPLLLLCVGGHRYHFLWLCKPPHINYKLLVICEGCYAPFIHDLIFRLYSLKRMNLYLFSLFLFQTWACETHIQNLLTQELLVLRQGVPKCCRIESLHPVAQQISASECPVQDNTESLTLVLPMQRQCFSTNQELFTVVPWERWDLLGLSGCQWCKRTIWVGKSTPGPLGCRS